METKITHIKARNTQLTLTGWRSTTPLSIRLTEPVGSANQLKSLIARVYDLCSEGKVYPFSATVFNFTRISTRTSCKVVAEDQDANNKLDQILKKNFVEQQRKINNIVNKKVGAFDKSSESSLLQELKNEE